MYYLIHKSNSRRVVMPDILIKIYDQLVKDLDKVEAMKEAHKIYNRLFVVKSRSL